MAGFGAVGKSAMRLSYLIANADASLAQLTDDSLLAQLLAKGGDVSDYNDNTDSLEALSDAIGAISTADPFLASVGGALNDAAAAGAVTDADTAMAYVKQLVTANINGTYGLSALQVLLAAIPTTAMRGTDSAYLASVGGALDTAAAAGAVTDADTAMAYIKQIVTYTEDPAGTTQNVPQFTGTIAYADAGQADNTGDGLSPENAKQTINAAIAVAGVGGAVTIKAGTYAEDVVMSYAAQELWCEIGTIFDGTGTCLTISGGDCYVRGYLKITPAADQQGVAITTLGGNVLDDVRVVGAASAGGFDIDTTQNTLNRCKCSGIKTGGKAFDIGASASVLRDCSTAGTTTSYGFYVDGTSLLRGVLVNCTSAGHQTSGFYLDEISGMTVLNCSSGASDGKWRDIDNANVWSNFSYSDEVFKEIDMTDATAAFDLFTITGIVEIEFLHGHVKEPTNAELGNCLFRVHGTDGPTNANLTTATACTSLPAGSLIAKIADASVALSVSSSAAPFVVENTNFRDPRVSAIVGADNSGTTTIQFFSDDSAGNKDGKIHFHCKWRPVSDNGFVAAA